MSFDLRIMNPLTLWPFDISKLFLSETRKIERGQLVWSSWVYHGFSMGFVLLICFSVYCILYFIDHCLSLWPFSSDHYVSSPSSFYSFWLPLWYPKAFLITLLFRCFNRIIIRPRHMLVLPLNKSYWKEWR